MEDKSCNPADFLYLQVRDKGCGMNSETIKHIFEPFFSTKFAGRGLGMSAVFGIIQGLHGHIHITSVQGEGTTIELLFPRHQNTLIQLEPIISQPSIANQNTQTILIIDDEDIVRDTCSAILECSGYRTLTAQDGPSGIECYQHQMQQIRCVILDMTMPIMDGRQCFLALRKINPNVPVIISSGYSQKDVSTHFEGNQPTAYLHKPYSGEALVEIIKSLSS